MTELPDVSGPFDPSGVETRAELATALRALRHRCGLSIERMVRAAGRLPPGSGRLARSTISDIEQGKTLPQQDTFRAFLLVCEVPPDTIPGWLAAWERASTAHLPRPASAVRVRDAEPRRLGVHAAIVVGNQDNDLPEYVTRDVDDAIRAFLDKAASSGGFLLLVGGSSVGKTRMLFEALRSWMADWWLLCPAFGAEVATVVQARPARTVVWLDELQRYIDGPQRLTAATVRALLAAGVVVVGTIWPREYDARMATADVGGADEADTRALLDLATTVVVAATFTETEMARAKELARVDGRLDLAVRANDPGVTQVLAAGPDLQRRWEHADDPYGEAVITAAVDARRLGMLAPLAREHLAAAVPGYLTSVQQADASADWLAQALAYATAKVRGAASALIPDSGGVMGQVAGYRAADYLLQRGFETRRSAMLPETAWKALVSYATDPVDIRRLAYSADTRWRYTYAVPLYRKLAADGDEGAGRRLADIVANRSPRQAIAALHPFRETAYIVGQLTELMADIDDVAGLRQAAEHGDLVAGCRLVDLLGATDLDQVRAAAGRGNQLAVGWLIDHDGDDHHLSQLRDRADAGDRLARGRLAEALGSRQQVDQAITLLAISADRGDSLAPYHLADLLIRHGRTSELQERADAGDNAAEAAGDLTIVRGGHIACRVAGALADHGDPDTAIAILTAHAAAHVELADEYLIDLLVTCDRIDLLRDRAATGEWSSNHRLATLAAAHGDIDQLRELEAEGNWFATQQLVELIIEQGQLGEAIDHLKARAAAGDELAAGRLPDLLVEAGREDELRSLAQTDPWYASGCWARYLAATDRLDEAIQWLSDQRGPGADLAASDLADLLVQQGRIDDALDILRPFTTGSGDGPSVNRLVTLLADHKRTIDLRIEVNAGASGAMEQLLHVLLQQGAIDTGTVDRAHREGVTASWPHDGSSP
ncbi:helix-turn-helix domain-containing protein [Micromonospora wenchangensis]|uniref:helix-turn-helix domain-containing protein n=1 Tax=Micromonospora wenchangensis TaxID=1185415 RepID=UPI003D71D894